MVATLNAPSLNEGKATSILAVLQSVTSSCGTQCIPHMLGVPAPVLLLVTSRPVLDVLVKAACARAAMNGVEMVPCC